MTFNPDIHQRHSIRLAEYDYAQAGAYFVTVCTWQRDCLFGEIIAGEMMLNELGRVVENVYRRLFAHFINLNLDEYSIMPNHFHAILLIQGTVGAKQDSPALPAFDLRGTRAKHENTVLSPLRGTMPGSICSIIQNFKSVKRFYETMIPIAEQEFLNYMQKLE
jgi:REP element-mobilizing transposase RayT